MCVVRSGAYRVVELDGDGREVDGTLSRHRNHIRSERLGPEEFWRDDDLGQEDDVVEVVL
jgi:hypothetical protein